MTQAYQLMRSCQSWLPSTVTSTILTGTIHASLKSLLIFLIFHIPLVSYCVTYRFLLNPTLGGTKEYKVLMDQFHHVAAAFLELEKGLVLLYAPPIHFCCVLEFFCSRLLIVLICWNSLICLLAILIIVMFNLNFGIWKGIKRLSRKLLKEWVQGWPSLSAKRSVVFFCFCFI